VCRGKKKTKKKRTRRNVDSFRESFLFFSPFGVHNTQPEIKKEERNWLVYRETAGFELTGLKENKNKQLVENKVSLMEIGGGGGVNDVNETI
jgi:hypothetical protein